MPLQLTTFPLQIPPTDPVSFHDGFDDDRHGSPHEAIDISAPEGTLVLAAADGLVLRSWMSGHGPVTGSGWSDRGGFVVAILDNNDYVHYYAHMRSAPNVNSGQFIRAGAVLGQVSNTGSIAHGSGKHLHYQVWVTGAGREQERKSGTFIRRFGRAVTPYDELVRLAVALRVQPGSNGSVRFNPPPPRARTHSRL